MSDGMTEAARMAAEAEAERVAVAPRVLLELPEVSPRRLGGWGGTNGRGKAGAVADALEELASAAMRYARSVPHLDNSTRVLLAAKRLAAAHDAAGNLPLEVISIRLSFGPTPEKHKALGPYSDKGER